MSVTANNPSMAATGTGGTLSVTVSTVDGQGIAPGDTIIAHTISNGTHAASVTVQDSVNATSFTQDKEQQLGGASALYQQVSRYVAAAAVPDGSTITLTPFAGSTLTYLGVTVIRYSLGTIANAYVSQPNAASASQAAPALGGAPTRGQFVMTFDASTGGTLTPAAGWTLDSNAAASGISGAAAYLTADGVGTFASTWTDAAGSQVSATMTVAYTAASVGVPYVIARANAGAGSNTLVATVGSPVGAASVSGDNIYVGILLPNTTNAPTTVVDNHARSFTQKGNFPAGNGLTLYFYELLNATTVLALTDTITATFSNTLLGKAMFVTGCHGMNLTADLDPTSPDGAGGSGTSTSLTTGTGQLANNNELMLAYMGAGSAASDIVWPSDWTELGQVQTATGGVYLSVAAKVVYSSDPVTVAPTLANSAVWVGMLLALTPDPPSGAAATVQIMDGSPLPAATVGKAYSYGPLTVQGGVKPYTFTESGAMPAGITLSPGSQGGSTPITHVGGMGGPDGASGNGMTYEDALQSTIGPATAVKLFYGADLPADWTGVASSSTAAPGVSPSAIVAKYPKCMPIVCWNTLSSAATITHFCASIPAGQPFGFAWQQEPENTNSGIIAKDYKDGMQKIADAIHALRRPELVVMHNAVWGGYMPSGAGVTGNYIPLPYNGTTGVVDCYCIDVYQHQAGGSFNGATTWPSQGLANHSGFQKWLSLVKKLADPLGIPLGINEYGVDDTGSLAVRNQRIQDDYNYIKTAFNGGAASSKPLFTWLYWWHSMAGSNTHYKFTDSATVSTWKGIAAGSSGAGGSSTGGVFSGTPGPASAGTYASIAVTAHDANNVASAAKTFSLTVNGSAALSWVSVSPLPGATASAPYNYQFQADGGKTPYVFSVHSGSVLPTGWSLTGAGVLSGTTTTPGTGTFSVDCTDANSTVITLACTVTISGGLTITTKTLPPGIAGVAYGPVTLGTSNGTGPFSWGLAADSIDQLPSGITLDPDLGVIAGLSPGQATAQLDVQVTDAAGATATQTMTLTIAPLTGGLPPIGRRRFGGTMDAWTFTFLGDAIDRAAGVTVIFYDAPTGGNQITDLTTLLGAPITSVVTDSNGMIPEFLGPDSVMEMYADANGGLGPRRRITAADGLDLLELLYNFIRAGG